MQERSPGRMNEQVGRGREGRLTLEGEAMKNEEGQILLTGAAPPTISVYTHQRSVQFRELSKLKAMYG